MSYELDAQFKADFPRQVAAGPEHDIPFLRGRERALRAEQNTKLRLGVPGLVTICADPRVSEATVTEQYVRAYPEANPDQIQLLPPMSAYQKPY